MSAHVKETKPALVKAPQIKNSVQQKEIHLWLSAVTN